MHNMHRTCALPMPTVVHMQVPAGAMQHNSNPWGWSQSQTTSSPAFTSSPDGTNTASAGPTTDSNIANAASTPSKGPSPSDSTAGSVASGGNEGEQRGSAAGSVDPALFRALEEQLSALAQHQTSLLTEIRDLNSSIERKDTQVAELSANKREGAAADEVRSRADRDAMLAELGQLRDEVTCMQSKMEEAAATAAANGLAPCTQLDSPPTKLTTRCTMIPEATSIDADTEVATPLDVVERPAESGSSGSVRMQRIGSGGNGPVAIANAPVASAADAHVHVSRVSGGDASSKSAERCQADTPDGASSSECSYTPRAAACTMRTPYGEDLLLLHDQRSPPYRKASDELDYFVPIVQRKRNDLTAIFHSARGVASRLGRSSGSGRRRGGRDASSAAAATAPVTPTGQSEAHQADAERKSVSAECH